MDIRYINPFIAASRNVFDVMIHLPLQVGKPKLRTNDVPDHAVSAVIGLGGDVTGTVILGFAQRVALALASGLAGTEFATLDADCIDALGEIVNMIAGAAKAQFPGGLSTISAPSVILGQHQVKHPSSTPTIVIPCQTSAGPFTIEVSITTPSAATSAPSPEQPTAALA